MKPLRWCDTCDEWEVALPELNVGVCGHVDELIDPEDLALYSTDVTGYVTDFAERIRRLAREDGE